MWDIPELRKYLELRGEQFKQCIDYLESVARTIDIFEYHKIEAFKIVSELDSTEPESMMDFIFATGIEEHRLSHKVLIAQAHLQAALHNSRAMYDILAQLLNVLLIPKPKKIHDCYIGRIYNELPNGKMQDELSSILDSNEYKYVNGFVNTIKHRNLIQLHRILDFQESRAAIRIKSFSFSGNYYEQLWAIDALRYALEVKNRLIKFGELLNLEYCIDKKIN